jgi:hypothetical protein
MDLRDAALMLLTESANYPAVAELARSAYFQLASGEPVDYRTLHDLLGEASGKGVLRALQYKYSPTAYQAMITPICDEIGRQAPVPPRRRPAGYTEPADPLTAPVW